MVVRSCFNSELCCLNSVQHLPATLRSLVAITQYKLLVETSRIFTNDASQMQKSSEMTVARARNIAVS